MNIFKGLTAAVAASAIVGLGTTSVASAQPAGGKDGHAVFVQTNNTAGNQILVYTRHADGSLEPAGTYDTGGDGAVLNGAVADTLASQGSLVYDAQLRALFAVNAGSDSLTVFRASGDHLDRTQVVSSHGIFPVSIAVHDDLVYVLNARDGGSVSGYRFAGAHLVPIPQSTRQLGLDATATPEFLNTPAQVGFTPDGDKLIVTTKGNGSNVLVFDVRPDGRLSDSPVVDPQGDGTAPFAFVFDASGHLVLTLAGTSTTVTFDVNDDGTLTQVSAVPDGQAAACWIVAADGHAYVSNAGSSNISVYADDTGVLTLTNPTVATDPGTIDAAVGGHHLYVQSGTTGIVDIFRIEADGQLTSIGSVTVPNAIGFEGIAAS